jgi:Protein of unknown function (DUF742)
MPGDRAGGGTDPHDWLDAEAGPLVRSFAMTGGRARSGAGTFDLLAYVVATEPVPSLTRMLQPEHRKILANTAFPISVAELASHVDLPLGVVRVLLGDLLEFDAIAIHEPDVAQYLPEDDVLKAVIHALRTL